MKTLVKKKIVVCGATGNQGGAVAAALLKSGRWEVAALARDPSSAAAQRLSLMGAEVVRADLQDIASLVAPFSNAYGVFGVTQPWSPGTNTFDTAAAMRQGKNVIWACKELGVEQVVMSTMINLKQDISGVPYIDSKLQLEKVFREHLPGGVIIRPSLYMENLGTAILRIMENGIKGRFAGHAKIPYAALEDIGKSVAGIFENPDAHSGETIDLIGDLVSGNEIASLFNATVSFRKFRYAGENRYYLQFLKPQFFRMRKFFERQGSIAGSHFGRVGERDLPSHPVPMAKFIEWNADRLTGL